MRFEVLILGNSSATPAYGRHPTSQLVRTDSNQFLIDCGEGTQIQLQRYQVKLRNLNTILISHLHGDHFYGLIGLITSFNLNGRTIPLNIYCPRGLENIIEVHLKTGQITLSFDLQFHFLDEGLGKIYDDNELTITAIPLQHRIPTVGFLFMQKQRKRNMNIEMMDKLSLSIPEIKAVKDGEDLHRTNLHIPNSELTIPPQPSKSYAFISDTLFVEDYVKEISNVDLLYHESTFPEELKDRAKETYHSTAKQAARAALQASASKLIIGHFSARYQNLEIFVEEAREIFPNTEIAKEGSLFEV